MIRPVPPPDFVPFPKDAVDASIPARWRLIAQQHASQPALWADGRTFTYEELDAESGKLARRIAAQVKENNANIAILRSDAAAQIVAMLAVLKAGHAFVILDPGQPFAHHEQLIAHAQASLVLRDGEFSGNEEAALPDRIDPASRAYLLYTSGSTGRPKGIGHTHRSVLHNAFKYANALGIAPSDHHALLGSLTFAASLANVFVTLLTGARLCVYPVRTLGVADLSGWMQREQITVYYSVPAIFRRWMETIQPGETFPDLRVIKLGGELVLRDDVDSFRNRFRPPTLLLNSLGTSELNTIRQYFIDHTLVLPEGATVPVGYAVPETGVELLDEEIVVHSDFLPAGYWHDPELTEKVFPGDGRRFFTGDRGRLLPDGCLLHLGRKDDRLKIRGVSIEPAEIESAIRSTGLARDAVVIACGEPPRLAAFVTGCPDSAQLRTALIARLPSHLVPAIIQVCEELPQLHNGKVDRRKLAASIQPSANAEPQPPSGDLDPLEIQLVEIWKKELHVDQAGIHDDFFALGGDSLTAVAVFAGIEKSLRVDLPISTLIHHPTVEKLAEVIRSGGWSFKDLRLVGLQIRGNKPPLYCVPGAASEALHLQYFARRLGTNQPCYAFQPKGMDGFQPYPRTVEEMAEYCLDILLDHQPRGPYRLCGTSFGGVIAYEMARKLVAIGHEVAFLGLLDSYGYQYPKVKREAPFRKKIEHEGLRMLLRAIRKEGFSLPTLQKFWREWSRLQLIRLDLAVPFRKLPRPSELRWTYSWEACDTARRRYMFRPYPGKIHLFRAEDQPSPELHEYSRDLGWAGLAAGGLEIHDIPGGHHTHLEEPRVAVVAKLVTECMERGKTT